MFKTGCRGNNYTCWSDTKRGIQAEEKDGLSDIDMVEHTQAEQTE